MISETIILRDKEKLHSVILKSAKLLHSLILHGTEFQELDAVTEKADLPKLRGSALYHTVTSVSLPPVI